MTDRRRPAPREVIAVGDIVAFDGYTWDVLGVAALGEATGHPSTQLRLERREQQRAPTPYGRPQRYTSVVVARLADAGRCRLVAHQESLF